MKLHFFQTVALGCLSLVLLSLAGCHSKKQANRVAATLRPVHSLVSALLEGTDIHPLLVVAGNQSPHALSLKPSQARMLEHAELIVQVSEHLETFTKPFEAQKPGRVISLATDAGLNLLYPATFAHQEAPPEDGEGHAGHHHDTDSTQADPHVWLDPRNMQKAARYLAKVFSKKWPAHKERIQRNLNGWLESLQAFEKETKEKFQALPRPLPRYILFHQGFRYFERQFGLQNDGAVRRNAAMANGTRSQSELRRKLQKDNIACLFSERQFNADPLKTLIAHTNTRLYQLDPLGSSLPPGPDLYLHLMQNIRDTFLKCFTAKGEAINR